MLLCCPRGDGNIYYSPYNGKQNWTRPLVVDPVCDVFLMLPGGDGRELIRHYKARSNMYVAMEVQVAMEATVGICLMLPGGDGCYYVTLESCT